MFIYSNTTMSDGRPVGFGGITIGNTFYSFLNSAVWDTDNTYFGFLFPTLYITAIPDKKEGVKNREDYCENGINEYSAEHAIVYRFSPRDMLATLDYLESEEPDSMPDDDTKKRRFCEYYTNLALIDSKASIPFRANMYNTVLEFLCEVLKRWEQHNDNE